MRRAPLALVVSVLALVITPAPAEASPSIKFGIQDDAWLTSGPGTLESRLDTLDRMGVTLVPLRAAVEPDRDGETTGPHALVRAIPASGGGASDDGPEGAARAQGSRPLVDLRYEAPGWANQAAEDSTFLPAVDGDDLRQPSLTRPRIGNRFPWVRDWLIWNEPNRPAYAQPGSHTGINVQRVLNHRIRRASNQATGSTFEVAERRDRHLARGADGMSPTAFLRGMKSQRALALDVYAHHPYPEQPKKETPSYGGCEPLCLDHDGDDREKLLTGGPARTGPEKHIWLTEYAYQTNPPDKLPRRLMGEAGAVHRRVVAARTGPPPAASTC